MREAGNAEEGLAALEEEPPDLILLDVMMPKVDGWEMLRRVQERHGVGTIPVIMFSGKVDEDPPAKRPRAARRASSASRSTRAADRVGEAAAAGLTARVGSGSTRPSALDRRAPRRRPRPALRRPLVVGSFGVVWLGRRGRAGAGLWRRPWLLPARRGRDPRSPTWLGAAEGRARARPAGGRAPRSGAARARAGDILVPVRPRGGRASPARPCSRWRCRGWRAALRARRA